MSWIALLRHGTTEWNERGLIQGQTDIPLSASGLAKLRQIRLGGLAEEFLRARWVTSPLQRARQTAAALNPRVSAEIHPDLIEADWGEFEGLSRNEVPQRIRDLALVPACGLDFRPPAGESPRMVRERLLRWCAKIAAENSDISAAVVAVTHKGVIRSALSAACGWEMEADFETTPDWSLPHIFRFDSSSGSLRLVRLNCPWQQAPQPHANHAVAPPS